MYAKGGCARDQATTQYCGEAVAAHARIAELEAVLHQIAFSEIVSDVAGDPTRCPCTIAYLALNGRIEGGQRVDTSDDLKRLS